MIHAAVRLMCSHFTSVMARTSRIGIHLGGMRIKWHTEKILSPDVAFRSPTGAYPDVYGAWPGHSGLCWPSPVPMMLRLAHAYVQAPPESEGAMHDREDGNQGGAVASLGPGVSKNGTSPIMYPSTWRTVSGGGCLQVKSQVSGFLSRSF